MVIISSQNNVQYNIDDTSPIYNSDLIVSFRDFEFEDVIKLDYSSETIDAINTKNIKYYKKLHKCIEICHMCDFIGLHNDYTNSAFDRLSTLLIKNNSPNVLIDNPQFIQYIVKRYPELYLLYDIEGDDKLEVTTYPDRYISPTMVKILDEKDLYKYIRSDNLKMVTYMIQKFKLDLQTCLDIVCQHDAYNILKYLIRKGVIPTSVNYLILFENCNIQCCIHVINIYNPEFCKRWIYDIIKKDNILLFKFVIKKYNLKLSLERNFDNKNQIYIDGSNFLRSSAITCYEFVRKSLNVIPKTFGCLDYTHRMYPCNIKDENTILRFLKFKEVWIDGDDGMYIIKHDYLAVMQHAIENNMITAKRFALHLRRYRFKNNISTKIYKYMKDVYPELIK